MRVIAKRINRKRLQEPFHTYTYKGVILTDDDGQHGFVIAIGDVPHLVSYLNYLVAEKDRHDGYTESRIPSHSLEDLVE